MCAMEPLVPRRARPLTLGRARSQAPGQVVLGQRGVRGRHREGGQLEQGAPRERALDGGGGQGGARAARRCIGRVGATADCGAPQVMTEVGANMQGQTEQIKRTTEEVQGIDDSLNRVNKVRRCVAGCGPSFTVSVASGAADPRLWEARLHGPHHPRLHAAAAARRGGHHRHRHRVPGPDDIRRARRGQAARRRRHQRGQLGQEPGRVVVGKAKASPA